MSAHSIEAKGLEKRFGSFRAVADVSFTVERGEIFGYLGANGAGKSTPIRMLCGLLGPTAGQALVAGHDVARDPEAVKASIGYMSQKFSLYLDLAVCDNLAFFGGAYGLSGRALRTRLEAVAELADLRDIWSTTTGSLPGGVRQRVALASAVLHQPEIVFLDEPTAGVDPVSRRHFWRLIRDLARSGTTVFVTTHYLDEAEYCRRVGLMVDGRLVALDTPVGLKRTFVPQRVFSVRGLGLAQAASQLRTQAGIHAVEPFGAGLHVQAVGDSAWSAEKLGRALGEAGATGVEVTETEPSLEDVFLAVVGREGREATP